MIALTTLKVLAAGLAAVFFQKNRLVKSWAFVLFAAVAAILAYDFEHNTPFEASLWFVHWIKTPTLNLNLGLKTGMEYAPFILGGVAVLLFSLYYNIFYPLEKDRLRAGGLYVLIFVLLMFILSAGNIMQLFLAICLLDILIFVLLPELAAKRLFLSFNLVADVLLFILFAFVWGQENSLYFSALTKYARHSSYPLLAFSLWIGAVAVKCGLAFFHNSILELKNISFVRQNFVATVVILLVGPILLYKTHALFNLVPQGELVLKVLAAISLAWGLWGCLFSDFLKARILYFYMMLSALFAVLLVIDRANFLTMLVPLICVGLLISAAMILPLIGAANEPLISQTGGFIQRMKVSFIFSIAVALVEAVVLLSFMNSLNQWWIVAFLFCHFIAFSHFLGQVYFGDVLADERVWAIVKNPTMFYFIPLLFLGGGLSTVCCVEPIFYILVPMAVVFFAWQCPLKRLGAEKQVFIQEEKSPVLVLYKEIFLLPLKFVGRVLWITIDFLFVERVMVALLRRFVFVLIRTSMFLHKNMRVCGWFFLLFGLGYAAAVFFWQKGAF